jgi:CRISPR/Cas system-associated protein Csx1
MSEIICNNHYNVIHGKVLPKDVAETISNINYNKIYLECDIVSSVVKADIPHKCNVVKCPLFRLYLRDKFWNIGFKALLYYESKKYLEKHLPDEIVLYILKILVTI